MSKITGVKAIQKKLVSVKKGHAKGLEIGILRAGLFLMRESQLLVPVQTGQLKASAQTNTQGSGLDVVVTVSYGTEYALYVHEDLEAAHGASFNAKYAGQIAKHKEKHAFYFTRGANQQAKYLEKPLREKSDEMVKIVEASLKQHGNG